VAGSGGTVEQTGTIVFESRGGTTALAGTINAAGGSIAGSKGGVGGSAGSRATAKGGTGAAGAAGTAGTKAVSDEFWISPDGNDSNPGTKEKPLLTLCDETSKKGACYKVCSGGKCMNGGATIWVMNGTYQYAVTQKIGSSKPGTENGVVRVWAEAGAKPIFDFSSQSASDANRGIQLQASYWHIKGITVTKAGDTGIFVMGSHDIIEQCITHHNQDAGLVIGVNSDVSGSGTDNLILNCDSYQNYDSASKGENADGFGLKENSGAGNVFRGCRAWDNADDGWDLYAWSSPVTLENCWAIKQTSTVYGSASDGNGFKLGGDGVRAAHKLSNCYSVGNGAHGTSGRGFTNNNNPASMSCTGTCGSWGNKNGDAGVSGISRTSGPSADKLINAARLANGDLPSIDSL
jgi:pectate disaccharide-lyase